MIGAEGNIGGRACICFVTSGWTCRWSRVSLPVQILLLHHYLVHSAHSRLTWSERLTRNAGVPTARQVTITLFGVPHAFATWLGLTGEEGEA